MIERLLLLFDARELQDLYLRSLGAEAYDLDAHDMQIITRTLEWVAGSFEDFLGVLVPRGTASVHLNSGGRRDPDARIYTKRDVEALISIAIALGEAKRNAKT